MTVSDTLQSGDVAVSKPKGERLLHCDFLRVVAIMLVILHHGGVFTSYPYVKYVPAASFSDVMCYIGWALEFSLVTVAVPVFMMISGALLLGRDESLGVLLKKRVLRFLSVLLLFVLIQYTYAFFKFSTFPYDWQHLKSVLIPYAIPPANPGTFYSMWFLFMYLAFLLCLPFLRGIARCMTIQNACYLLILTFSLHVLAPIGAYYLMDKPTALYINKYMFIFTDTIIYPLLGYALEKVINIKTWDKKYLLLFAVFVLLVTIHTVYHTYFLQLDASHGVQSNKLFGPLRNTPTLVWAICIYMMAQFLFSKWHSGNKIATAIVALGRLTFAIYLLEGIAKMLVFPSIIEWQKEFAWPPSVVCLVYLSIIYTMAAIAGRLLLFIPFMRKLL